MSVPFRRASSSPDADLSTSPTVAGISASTLVAQLHAGDRDAFGMLYDALFATLWRIAVKHTRSPEIAEDVVHEVFLSVWIRREQLQPDIDFRTYLATAVRYRARARWAHEHVVRASEEAVTHGLVDPLGMGQGMAAPDLVLERAELQSLYRHAVGTLTDREREAALLRWEEGFTIEQIAKILGLSVAGVHGVLLRAQRKVQTAVAAYRG